MGRWGQTNLVMLEAFVDNLNDHVLEMKCIFKCFLIFMDNYIYLFIIIIIIIVSLNK